MPLQVLAQGNTQSPPSDQASSDVTNRNSRDLTNAPQAAPPSTCPPSPVPSSSHKKSANPSDKGSDKTGDGNDDDQKTPEPKVTKPNLKKGDVVETRSASVNGAEPEQSDVDEGGVANG